MVNGRHDGSGRVAAGPGDEAGEFAADERDLVTQSGGEIIVLMKDAEGNGEKCWFFTCLWACVTDEGTSWELLGAPDDLKKNGLRVEVEVDAKNADATIGMMGRSGRVKHWRAI